MNEFLFRGTPYEFCQFLDGYTDKISERFPIVRWDFASGSPSFQQQAEIPEWVERNRSQDPYYHPEHVKPTTEDGFASAYFWFGNETLELRAIQRPDNHSIIQVHQSAKHYELEETIAMITKETKRLGFIEEVSMEADLIPNHGWDREAVNLWNSGKTAKEIGKLLEKDVQTINNKITKLRSQYPNQVKRKKVNSSK